MKKVLSIGSYGNAKIDVEAAASFPWCEGLYLTPKHGSRELMDPQEVAKLELDGRDYSAVLLWHQYVNEPTKVVLKKLLHDNPGLLIIGNSHGYNKSMTELIDLYGLYVPQYYMDFYSMWGPYFQDRYRKIVGEKENTHIISLGSLRHEYLHKTYQWKRGQTNGRVLLIHEPETNESWADPSPIGSNKLSAEIILTLNREKIPFDYKIHPNWPDLVADTGKKLWHPPQGTRLVNIDIPEMVQYDAVIASWSSTLFEAMAMGIPVVNVNYRYPRKNGSEWGPRKTGLLAPTKTQDISRELARIKTGKITYTTKKLEYFLGKFGSIGSEYYDFIKRESSFLPSLKRSLNRQIVRRRDVSEY